MALQNRVTPEGEIVAVSARGTMLGNRGGALHSHNRQLGRRRWASRQWICCKLAFKGRHREVMQPGRYTELFFLDEATALAAGHRPCFECRREDAERFAVLFASVHGEAERARADEMDRVLHGERVARGGAKVVHERAWTTLPTGSFVRQAGGAGLVMDGEILTWTPEGYADRRPRPSLGHAAVLTPPSIVAILARGYAPKLHASARVDG